MKLKMKPAMKWSYRPREGQEPQFGGRSLTHITSRFCPREG